MLGLLLALSLLAIGMATVKASFATPANITVTLASLASATARECTAIDNASNLYLDAGLYLAIKLQAGTPTGDRKINVYAYASADGTNYTDNATGTDAAVTLRVPTNLLFIGSIQCPDSGALTYKGHFASIAAAFGGVLPKKWGIVIENKTGVTFSATEGDHTKQYAGIYATTA